MRHGEIVSKHMGKYEETDRPWTYCGGGDILFPAKDSVCFNVLEWRREWRYRAAVSLNNQKFLETSATDDLV